MENRIEQVSESYSVLCPIKGEVIPLEEVPDSFLACGMLGPGVGIRPEEGIVAAPFDCEVSALLDTKHAVGLTSEEGGVEILIHIGINTVNLKGVFLDALVKPGDRVKAGQPLLAFDMEKIQEAGYDTTCAVLLSNLYLFPAMEVLGLGHKERLEPLLECRKKL